MNSLTILTSVLLSKAKTWIYRNNTFNLCSTFNAYKKSGTTVSIAKNADHMLLTITAAYGWAYSAEAINLTDYKTLYFYGYHTGASTMQFDVKADYTTYGSDSPYYASIPGGSAGLISFDVSALNGSYYVRFGRTINSNATDTIYCYQIYATK